MTKSVLFSIRPMQAEHILSGVKRFEYRRTSPKNIDIPYRAYLYAIQPKEKVMGDIIIDKDIENNPETIIKSTSSATPNNPNDLREYFKGKETGHALRIDQDSINRYLFPKKLRISPPQNFRYIEKEPWKLNP